VLQISDVLFIRLASLLLIIIDSFDNYPINIVFFSSLKQVKIKYLHSNTQSQATYQATNTAQKEQWYFILLDN